MTEFNRLFDDLEDKGAWTTADKTLRGRLGSVEDALRYMLAGKATITLESLKTKKRFTYSIRASDDGKCFFVSLLAGPDNEADYRYLGRITGTTVFWPGRKIPKPGDVSRDAPSMKAFEWTLAQLHKGRLPETLAIWHEGRCGRCHRKLTVPSSVKQGFGPECVGRL